MGGGEQGLSGEASQFQVGAGVRPRALLQPPLLPQTPHAPPPSFPQPSAPPSAPGSQRRCSSVPVSPSQPAQLPYSTKTPCFEVNLDSREVRENRTERCNIHSTGPPRKLTSYVTVSVIKARKLRPSVNTLHADLTRRSSVLHTSRVCVSTQLGPSMRLGCHRHSGRRMPCVPTKTPRCACGGRPSGAVLVAAAAPFPAHRLPQHAALRDLLLSHQVVPVTHIRVVCVCV